MSLFWKIQTRAFQNFGPWVVLIDLVASGEKRKRKIYIHSYRQIREFNAKFRGLIDVASCNLHALSFPS